MQNFLKIREKEFHKNRNESFSCIGGSMDQKKIETLTRRTINETHN